MSWLWIITRFVAHNRLSSNVTKLCCYCHQFSTFAISDWSFWACCFALPAFTDVELYLVILAKVPSNHCVALLVQFVNDCLPDFRLRMAAYQKKKDHNFRIACRLFNFCSFCLHPERTFSKYFVPSLKEEVHGKKSLDYLVQTKLFSAENLIFWLAKTSKDLWEISKFAELWCMKCGESRPGKWLNSPLTEHLPTATYFCLLLLQQ